MGKMEYGKMMAGFAAALTTRTVVLSGIDTTEALTVAGQKKKEGKNVWAVPYDYIGACQAAPDVCLGVAYFNWGSAYVPLVKAAMSKTWKQEWLWIGPDWKDINNPDISLVGFVPGLPAQVFQVAPFPLMVFTLLVMPMAQREAARRWAGAARENLGPAALLIGNGAGGARPPLPAGLTASAGHPTFATVSIDEGDIFPGS